ncbi:unnamed protein product [Dibothriocephalus latus]|uniref:Helicase ATP-binding domain-containing protein n=1 Tax=Dibothriocephalus latus TaxID=60516 RepID=A0A3P6PBL6_DIBLA|nr:unnamed protein product [Dibothriocephalus latus]
MEKSIIDKSVIGDISEGKYDDSNQLVLPGKKKPKQKAKNVAVQPLRVLSKSKRKELQKQVAKKTKKLSRKELWDELEAYATQPSDKSTSGNLFSQSSSADTSTDTDEFSSSEEAPKQEDSSVSELPRTTEPEREKSPTRNPPENVLVVDVPCKKSNYVLVNRTPEIQSMRVALPIVAEESNIMEAISENDVVIICGATGCGKTTQIPQFLYEAGYTHEVSYHIRYEKNVSSKTQIKFMTDGILLQEVKKVSARPPYYSALP